MVFTGPSHMQGDRIIEGFTVPDRGSVESWGPHDSAYHKLPLGSSQNLLAILSPLHFLLSFRISAD